MEGNQKAPPFGACTLLRMRREKLWSAAACCRFASSQLAGGESRAHPKSREQARGEESGSKRPHSKASHRGAHRKEFIPGPW